MSTEKRVTLLNFRITDYKGIANIEKEVNGRHFIVCGHNAAGKTSLLETINRSALRIDPKEMADIPIRLGAKNANFSMIYKVEENGEESRILIRTTMRPSGSEMAIINLDKNEELKPPVTKIREILGDSIDMSPIMDLTGKQQIEFLFKALGGTEVFDNLELKIKKTKEQKSAVNLRIKDAKDAMNRVNPGHQELLDYRTMGSYSEEQEMPVKENKSAAILLEKMAAEKNNEQRGRALDAIHDIDIEIEELELKISALKQRKENGEKFLQDNPVINIEQFDERLAAVVKDDEYFQQQVDAVKRNNELYRKIQDFLVKEADLMELEKQSKQYDVEIVELKQGVRNAISDLKLSTFVPGLDVQTEDNEETKMPAGIYYGGLPFNSRQISYGKCVVVLAILSSYVNGGKFNFIHIKDWESLDKTSRKTVLDFAKNNPELNVQFGIEEVTDTVLGVNIITD
jgi:hypothetical protein